MESLLDIYGARVPFQQAVQFLYQLLRERPSEATISHGAMPTFEQHRAFVTRQPYRKWFIIATGDGEWVGALNLTDRNEIGIAILKTHQRRGYAIAALQCLQVTVEPLQAEPGVRRGRFVANVALANNASHALFLKAGGEGIQITYEL